MVLVERHQTSKLCEKKGKGEPKAKEKDDQKLIGSGRWQNDVGSGIVRSISR